MGARPGSKKAASRAQARPSASVMVLSAANEVLLLQRVQSSTSFASAHVFPGGNLDGFHDGPVPEAGSPERHSDGPAYRMAAVRECFEETGILLARDAGRVAGLSSAERDAARARVHGGEQAFGDWLASMGAVADTDGLVPFTRWITPVGAAKRFTTQMYLYALPAAMPSEMMVPTPDKGIEHTAALFLAPGAALARVAAGTMTLFPPQYYLLHLVDGFLATAGGPPHRDARRDGLLAWLRRAPAAGGGTSWADKVICPVRLPVTRADGRIVLGLDKAGPELDGAARAGDPDRVVLVSFKDGVPRQLEVRPRTAVMGEHGRL